jgi:hypothetical protein
MTNVWILFDEFREFATVGVRVSPLSPETKAPVHSPLTQEAL